MTDNSTGNGDYCLKKPDISYPCMWDYRVIGTDRQKLEEIIIAACAPRRPTIELSNISSSGRYYSLNATLEVDSEETRLDIFKQLQDNPEVKMVI